MSQVWISLVGENKLGRRMIYYASDNPNGFVTGKRFSIDKPCVSVMAAGMGGDSLGHWHFYDDGKIGGGSI